MPLPAPCSGSPGVAGRSPRVRRCCFTRALPDLPPQCLDDFRASPSNAGLPHCAGLLSGLCSSGPRLASGFLPTPHRCDAVAFGSRFPSPRPAEDFHLQHQRHAWRTIGSAALPGNRAWGLPLSFQCSGRVAAARSALRVSVRALHPPSSSTAFRPWPALRSCWRKGCGVFQSPLCALDR